MNYKDRLQWVDNQEDLYRWWLRSGLSKIAFVRAKRARIDEIIKRVMAGKPPFATRREAEAFHRINNNDGWKQ